MKKVLREKERKENIAKLHDNDDVLGAIMALLLIEFDSAVSVYPLLFINSDHHHEFMPAFLFFSFSFQILFLNQIQTTVTDQTGR